MNVHSRRRFLRYLLLGSMAVSGCGRREAGVDRGLANRDVLSNKSASVEGSPANAFLIEAGAAFKGTRLRILTEDTPPSLACKHLVETEFRPVSGIEVEWTMEPLNSVMAKVAMDATRSAGHYDLIYLDHSWLARFAPELEPMEPWLERSDLAYPDWDFSDFLSPLVAKTASYGGRLLGIPYDIAIFIGIYRRDVFDALGVRPPQTLNDWMRVCAEVDQALSPELRGTTAQWKAGHYSLLCDTSAWLWAHGGSFFKRDGSSALDDDAALDALSYMQAMSEFMPAAVTTWDWHGESLSFARGEAAMYASWAEFFPLFDNPRFSRIVGKAEAAALPLEKDLRSPGECAFGETPGFSHQGGSCLSMPRHARRKEAAWLLLQWLVSADVAVRACLMGSGASAIRESTFSDPRIRARESEIGPGTTRYFSVMRDAILNRMGTGPHHPKWPSLAMGPLPNELGRMVTGQQGVRRTAEAMARTLNEQVGA